MPLIGSGGLTDAQKTKLDGIEPNANNYIHPDTHSANMITETETEKIMTGAERTKLAGVAENANAYEHPDHSGDVTSAGDGETTIADGAVTNAKMANMATQTVKGRNSAETGSPEDLSVATLKTMLAHDLDEHGTVTLAELNAKISDADIPSNAAATTNAAGLVELATTAETQAGTDATRAVTPATSGARDSFATTSTDDATSATAAPLKTAGGLAVAKTLFLGDDSTIKRSQLSSGGEVRTILEKAVYAGHNGSLPGNYCNYVRALCSIRKDSTGTILTIPLKPSPSANSSGLLTIKGKGMGNNSNYNRCFSSEIGVSLSANASTLQDSAALSSLGIISTVTFSLTTSDVETERRINVHVTFTEAVEGATFLLEYLWGAKESYSSYDLTFDLSEISIN